MYNAQYTNKQTFFEPYYEQLIVFRKQSECSIQNWNVFDQQRDNDLQLIIQEVDVTNTGLGYLNYAQENMKFQDDFFDDHFENLENYGSSDKYKDESYEKQQTVKPDVQPQKKMVRVLPIAAKTKKINKKHKHSKSSKHKFSLNKICYQKNICRNIIRKAIRAVECLTYQSQILYLCNQNKEFYEQFLSIIVSNVESITGPRALTAFLQPQDDVSKVFRKFLIWYLKEKYVIEALTSGQMDRIEKYILFKNQVLLPLLKSF